MSWSRVALACAGAIVAGLSVGMILRYWLGLACLDCDNQGGYPHPCETCGRSWGDAEPN